MSLTEEVIRRTLEKKFGDTLEQTFTPTAYISTGIPTIDYALARPGIACGRVTVIKGNYATGKSSILHTMIADCQRKGGVAVLLETEDAIDLKRMSVLGVDVDKLKPLIFQPGCMEEAINLMGELIELVRDTDEDCPVLIGWDSIASTPTRREVEGEAGLATMGEHSRLIGGMFRKYTGILSKQRVALVLVNQTRSKVATMPMPFADNSTMIAEKPLMYHASVVLDVRRVGTIKEKGKDATGINLEVYVQKNKLGAPYRTGAVDLDFQQGFLLNDAWMDLGVETGVLKKNGAWLSYGETKFQAKDWGGLLLKNPNLIEEIKGRMYVEEETVARA